MDEGTAGRVPGRNPGRALAEIRRLRVYGQRILDAPEPARQDELVEVLADVVQVLRSADPWLAWAAAAASQEPSESPESDAPERGPRAPGLVPISTPEGERAAVLAELGELAAGVRVLEELYLQARALGPWEKGDRLRLDRDWFREIVRGAEEIAADYAAGAPTLCGVSVELVDGDPRRLEPGVLVCPNCKNEIPGAHFRRLKLADDRAAKVLVGKCEDCETTWAQDCETGAVRTI